MEANMRQLILLVCVIALSFSLGTTAFGGIIPGWEAENGKFGFSPISNELSLYKNVDDDGNDRGKTLQIISINSFRLLTDFSFEFTADYNYDFTPGLDNDHYVELSLVKSVTPFISVNYQRVISTFEPKPVNQFGLRLVF